MSIAMLNEILP